MTAPSMSIIHYPLGALIQLDDREGWISAFSRTNPPLYRVTFLDDLQPPVADWVPHSHLQLLEKYPVSDARLSAGLREYLNKRRSADV